MEYAIGIIQPSKAGKKVILMTQCTDPQYNGKIYFNDQHTTEDKAFLVRFDPQDQYCTIISLKALLRPILL